MTHTGAHEKEEDKTNGPFVTGPDRHPIDSSILHWQSLLYRSGTAASMPRIPHSPASLHGATREAPVSEKNLMAGKCINHKSSFVLKHFEPIGLSHMAAVCWHLLFNLYKLRCANSCLSSL